MPYKRQQRLYLIFLDNKAFSAIFCSHEVYLIGKTSEDNDRFLDKLQNALRSLIIPAASDGSKGIYERSFLEKCSHIDSPFESAVHYHTRIYINTFKDASASELHCIFEIYRGGTIPCFQCLLT